ncbi:TetR/AcrR family transcriptional regulator [Actinosynnema sp.]|uniref:TetR/AcrR family transcriptional regulator n=1 Tax=Actinosynnema sp. TaxID=1872144 RepID=UPI003F84EA33
MGRWEPNARERLQRSALALFAERGYDSTTAAGIAEGAGLGKSTFFRHFADKREVLFDGQEQLNEALVAAIAAAPAEAGPYEVIGLALDAMGAFFGPERLEWARQRQAVVQAHSELRERELLKIASLTEAFATSLRARGLGATAAGVAAELGGLAFRAAFAGWIAPDNALGFPEVARRELAAVREAAASLD